MGSMAAASGSPVPRSGRCAGGTSRCTPPRSPSTAAIAVVPVALLAIWLTALVAGADRVRRLTSYAVEALPTAIGAPRAVAALVEAGLELTPLLALAALLPASLYGEGLRRAFVSVALPRAERVAWSAGAAGCCCCRCSPPAPACCCRSCWRCRSTTRLVRQGGWIGALGVVLSFLAVWLVLTPVLIWVFRVVGPGRAGLALHRCWSARSPRRTSPASCTASCCSARSRSTWACRSAASTEIGGGVAVAALALPVPRDRAGRLRRHPGPVPLARRPARPAGLRAAEALTGRGCAGARLPAA